MSYNGLLKASEMLQKGLPAGECLVVCIQDAEYNPAINSVGVGGLPNRACEVELDAGYMDGSTLRIGAVGAIKDFKSPIAIAKKLSEESDSNFLTGEGAGKYAQFHGFERINTLTQSSKDKWTERVKEADTQTLISHDTIGAVCLDKSGAMAAGTSTSGLFMKHPGRLGDSPLIGSGFYVDSDVGGACATGTGEDIMKGCLSYEIVRRMAAGESPKEAAENAFFSHNSKLQRVSGVVRSMSVICMNKDGEWSAATNQKFPFAVAVSGGKPLIYFSDIVKGKFITSLGTEDNLMGLD